MIYAIAGLCVFLAVLVHFLDEKDNEPQIVYRDIQEKQEPSKMNWTPVLMIASFIVGGISFMYVLLLPFQIIRSLF